ncbi:hypothetical protein LDO26_05015 [Luteimonas sp. BDR2-5]|uniref:hypothetical protein n=1 Tax=Proluteimonas luteida TaxID=2878685 RepID=UPI001E2A34DF|nr:hypothetical protein [Luteimonas sp. BDR2-5]MCD9027572.1 hypothetical protein [Luteimonas sp. BDR2-5]
MTQPGKRSGGLVLPMTILFGVALGLLVGNYFQSVPLGIGLGAVLGALLGIAVRNGRARGDD